MTYRRATYEEARSLVGGHAKHVGCNPRSTYLGAFDGERIVACVGWMQRGKTIELCSAITLPEYRRRGIYSVLCRMREAELAKIPHRREIAYCTPYSLPRMLAAGFVVKKKYNISTLVERVTPSNTTK